MSLLCNAFPSMNSICVNTGEVKISEKTLVTGFVITCSVIGFSYNNKNFLAHIDAMKPGMKNEVINEINKLNPTFIDKINIWKGSKCNYECPSFAIAKEITNNLKGNIIIHQANNDLIKITRI